MRVAVDGARLFTDFEGAKLCPDGPWLREVPTVVIVHTGPGTDHTPYKEHIGPVLAALPQELLEFRRNTGAGHGVVRDRPDALEDIVRFVTA